MNIRGKWALTLSACLFFTVICKNVQSQSITGIYSGVELSLSPLMGGGMDREDLTFYLRPDKTFSNKVDKAGWKTAVHGTWSIAGQEVVFTFNDPKIKPRHFDIVKPDRLRTGNGYILYKMDIANSIPKGVYEFKHASGMGGLGSNMPYVGVSGSQFIYFDGQGNFTQETEKMVAVIGEHIGGGNNSNKSASGTYRVKDGELTLNFADGHITTHSILVNKDRSRETMAFIDGDAFFLQTEEEIAKKIGNEKTIIATTRGTTTPKKETTTAALSATSLVDKIREKHGTSAIDGLKSIIVTGSVQGIELKAITDFMKEWTRLETRQNGQLKAIEQLEGNSGWQWVNGKKTSLTPQRIKEMQADFSAGFAGLRPAKRSLPAAGTVKKEKFGYSLIYTVNGIQLGMLTNDDFEVMGEVKQTANGIQTIVYSDYRNVDGLRIPFGEKHTLGNTTINIRISQVEINKATKKDFEGN